MINLFKAVYVRPDNYITPSQNQKRIIFTDREYDFNFSQDPVIQANTGVLAVLKNMDDLNEKYGNLDTFFGSLYSGKNKVLVIAGKVQLATLLVTYWKSIFATPTVDFLFELYQSAIINENLMTTHFHAKGNTEGLQYDVEAPYLDKVAFAELYETIEASEVLKRAIKREDVPVEYLLAGYLAGTNTPAENKVTLKRVRTIVTANMIGVLANDRAQFFSHTHNQYLLDGGVDSEAIINPLDVIRNNPKFNWLFDVDFTPSNVDGVLKKYKLTDLKEMFNAYNVVFAKGKQYFEAEIALDFLIKDDIPGMLAFDILDENANFFTEPEFFKKINTLLISRFYQLVRLNRQAELAVYKLL